MPRNPFTHSAKAARGLFGFARKLTDDGVSESDALRISATTMDGAGNGETVESVQTCRGLDKKPIAGLTTDDGIEPRKDKFASSQEARHKAAEAGEDEAARWLAEHGNDRGRRR